MWPFKRTKTSNNTQPPGPPCPHCGSTKTGLIIYHGTDQSNYTKIWRGQRALTYRCFECGLDFYAEEPQGGMEEEIISDDRVIDDEEALREAEEKLRKEAEEDNDRRCW
jgi:DNA-directed RNA polymerase subunit RPC12/RpoP